MNLMPEFTKRNIKVVGLSCDSIESHVEWCKDIITYAGMFTLEMLYSYRIHYTEHIYQWDHWGVKYTKAPPKIILMEDVFFAFS